MAPQRLHLKENIDPQDTLRRLHATITESSNLSARTMGFGPEAMRNEYLLWAEAAESLLHASTPDPEVPAMLTTSRYELIRAIGPETPRPWPLVDAEIQVQTQQLKRYADDLQHRIAIATSDRPLVVLDTSALLEFLPPEQIPWPDLLEAEEVRLVIPLRTIEELDRHKRAFRPGLAKRARRLLQRLERSLVATGRRADLSSVVSWEVLVVSPPRWRPQDPDEEILGVAQELQHLGATAVSIATDDAGMRLRARALEIPLVDVPARFHRERE